MLVKDLLHDNQPACKYNFIIFQMVWRWEMDSTSVTNILKTEYNHTFEFTEHVSMKMMFEDGV